jgi:hypothetical protein
MDNNYKYKQQKIDNWQWKCNKSNLNISNSSIKVK